MTFSVRKIAIKNPLNRNIGCIEMQGVARTRLKNSRLNRNIGCIEIFYLKNKGGGIVS